MYFSLAYLRLWVEACFSVEVLESVQELGDRDPNAHYVDELLDDVEALSDSDVDMDTISVRSTPKPKLRYSTEADVVIAVLVAIRWNNVWCWNCD